MSLAENVTTLPQSRDGSYEFARFNAPVIPILAL